MRRRFSGIVAAAAAGVLVVPTSAVWQTSTAAPTAPPPDTAFQKVTLNDRPGEPMDLAVLPDNSVLHTTRAGVVWHNDAETGVNSVAARLEVYQHDEEGLQSIALQPGFDGAKKNWVYLYYSPPQNTPVDDPATPDVNEGDAPVTGTPADFAPFEGVIRVSRFRFADGEIKLGTEQRILDVPVDRGICCHVGGDIVFDSDGNLILATGDDTNPFESDGYVPIDERADRNPAFDAQRTAANTNDLRGKVLRVTPKNGGGYKIPKGNLFLDGLPRTRPEIYAMGLRNPFRIEIDPRTDALYVADYSPDANAADPTRGPAGHGRWLHIEKPANYGWPYCVTPDLPYNDYDFATETSGAAFDCARPVNDSPHNTGRPRLPRVAQPEVWYSYGQSPEFPALETGGIGPMAGPAYAFDKADRKGKRPVGWPKYFDGMPLFYEWTRDYIKGFRLDARGAVSSIEDVLPSVIADNPMDLEFGPDGALYMLEYGDGFFAENPEAQLSRIDFIGQGGNHSPVPAVSADPTNGATPLEVTFSSEGTADPDGDRVRYAWDFEGDGKFDSFVANPTHTYDEAGAYRATLTVFDFGGKHRGRHASADVDVVVGNAAPSVTLTEPVEGQPFQFGDTVTYAVTVEDDQPVDCARVTVTYILGHDNHGHPQSTATGCTGSLVTTVPGGHDPGSDNLTGVFVAEYTDPGGDGLPALSGSDQVVLTPTP
ncbi:MAG: PQQ-dependent sugar dehydrogenase [Nocardioides sp.]